MLNFIAVSVIVIIPLLLIYHMHSETQKLETNKIHLSTEAGLKIAHISDLHINKMYIPFSKILSTIKAESPDLVVITGDCIDKKSDKHKLFEFLDLLDRDSIMCLGNHEYVALDHNPANIYAYKKELKSKKVTVLDNEHKTITKGHKKYNLIGISDIRHSYYDIDKAFSGLKNENSDAVNIVITHTPDIALHLAKHKVDCLLCGHYHGGQIRTYTNIEFARMQNEKLWKMGFIKGLYHFNGMQLYINKGLGNSHLPLRLFSRPEIAIIYI